MSEPRRLLDDPDAPAELREALGAELRGAQDWDPGPLGERVAAAASAGASLGAGVGAGAGATASAGGILVGTKALVATALVSAALGAGGHAAWTSLARPQPALIVPAPAAEAVVPVPTVPVPQVASAPTGTESAAAPASARAPRAPRPAADAPRGTSALAEELRLYERGEAALAEGHLEVAVRELRRYLAEHPRGTLRAEAELALVQALARSGRCEEAQARARRAPVGSDGEAQRAAASACRERP